ncbi:diguanylate cyclase [Glaciecola sp. XM2]|jgi:diguanylate cyclase (GGDEF)-like protein/PAS domain S-box-containing protein|uniref:diguanylate cyclase n=1 Tax=Glaciecola sp. XM2 TaxID=1914931 RepID=UPI001BDE12AA|nr:diguanylate cyclase [Glaciecola sp. XM2]MBT1451475.1 diguanylate cyclase [Glaciecola sp. XM2]
MSLESIDFPLLLDHLQTGVVIHASDSRVLYANPKALEILRLREEQVLNVDAYDPSWQLLDQDSLPLSAESLPVNRVIASKQSVSNLEIGIADQSTDSISWMLCNAHPQFDQNNEIAYIVVDFIDITKQKEEIPYKDIVERAGDAIIVTDANYQREQKPKIVYTNESFTKLSEYTSEEIKGQNPSILQGKDTALETKKVIADALSNNRAITCEILNYTKSNKPYWVELSIFPLFNRLGKLKYFTSIARDISTRVATREELKQLAQCDPLTDLLNRRGFDARVQALNNENQESGQVVAILDIDHFKEINDQFGHATGDEVLKAFSGSIKHAFRGNDIVARWGGEEFIILFSNIDINLALDTMERFRKLIASRKYAISSHHDISFTISVGMAKRKPSLSLYEAITEADNALYRAKQSGRNCVSVANAEEVRHVFSADNPPQH